MIWMTAAEMSPITRACGMVGRMTRIARQKAETMNSGAMAPPETAEMALPAVKLRMKPAASRTASKTRLWMSRPRRSSMATVRGRPLGWNGVVMGGSFRELGRLRSEGGKGGGRGLGMKKGPRSNRRPRVTWMVYGYEDSPSTGRRRVMPPPVVEGDERDLLHDDGSFRAIGGRNVG